MFYEQLEKICKKNDIAPTTVTVELGLSKGTMSNWKKGATPNGDVVVRFAKHFNMSTDYFLVGDSNVKTQDKNTLTDVEQELIETYNKLDARGQHKLHTTIYEELDRIDNDIKKSKSKENNVG